MGKIDVKTTPIVQWPGGKKQLLPIIMERLPKDFKTYYEPFFGGGALFFALRPDKATINDFNEQLINIYQQIQTDYKAVLELLDGYSNAFYDLDTKEDKKEYYYARRTDYNTCLTNNELSPKSAALFLFLNKSCFNALYRVNKSGQFNSPFGTGRVANFYNLQNIQNVSKLLSKTKILNGDFEQACEEVKEGDFVFIDSPYYGTFDTYQAGGFKEEDHKRLAELFKKLDKKGAYLMLTNSDTDYIKDLYKGFNQEIVSVNRCINRDGANRKGHYEIIITNYDKEGKLCHKKQPKTQLD